MSLPPRTGPVPAVFNRNRCRRHRRNQWRRRLRHGQVPQGTAVAPGQPAPLPPGPGRRAARRSRPIPRRSRATKSSSRRRRRRSNNPTAVFSGLDKITGRIITFDVAINETVQFGALAGDAARLLHAAADRDAEHRRLRRGRRGDAAGRDARIFTGWMFAASPGLHAVEHPIYDVWLTDCKGAHAADGGGRAARARARRRPRSRAPPQHSSQRRRPRHAAAPQQQPQSAASGSSAASAQPQLGAVYRSPERLRFELWRELAASASSAA